MRQKVRRIVIWLSTLSANGLSSVAFFERVWPNTVPGFVEIYGQGLRKAGLDQSVA